MTGTGTRTRTRTKIFKVRSRSSPIGELNNTQLYNDLTIIQHMVMHWTPDRTIELANLYNKSKPDIILLNSITPRPNKTIKKFNYSIYSRNYLNELHAGIAIAVRSNLQYKIINDFNDDILGIKIKSVKGPFEFYTIYSPPRRNYLPLGEIRRILQKNIPTYIIGDMNAQHPISGYTYTNNKGTLLKKLVERHNMKYLGPDFPALVRRNGRTDVITSNK